MTLSTKALKTVMPHVANKPILLSVVMPLLCHYGKCNHAECRGVMHGALSVNAFILLSMPVLHYLSVRLSIRPYNVFPSLNSTSECNTEICSNRAALKRQTEQFLKEL